LEMLQKKWTVVSRKTQALLALNTTEIAFVVCKPFLLTN
jgi:hypothetical protein